MQCQNCGRGYEHADPDFICEVCGAHNRQDGWVEYDDSPSDCEWMTERIQRYDREQGW